MDSVILHCDLNNFYASAESIDHPEYKNIPLAVCGRTEDRHGIVLAKNELAKKFGVSTGEVIWQAKMKCPDLITITPNMDKYIYLSKKVQNIYKNYTDQIEPFGIDECWLDVTGSRLLFGNGEEIAYKIKEHVKKETGLTISVGVSFNKIFAKLGSDLKKPDAVTCITQNNFKDVVWNLPACEMLGVGRSTYKKLIRYGINTIGDLANSNLCFLKNLLGKNGELLYYYANGSVNNKVMHQDESTIIKSIGNSITCPTDLFTIDDVWKVMYFLSESVSKRLRKNNLLATSIQISIKDTTLLTKEFQAPLPVASRHPKDLSCAGIKLVKQNYKWENNIRAVGIRAINLISEKQDIQCNLLYNQNKINKLEELEKKVYNLRTRFGDSCVVRGSLLTDVKIDKDRYYDEVTLPHSINTSI